ncbi:MAG: TetR/AcrR family transcriptional regulator [Acidimicrobiales bacterium]
MLEAAGRLLVERGLGGTTMDAIAAEAGVSKASVYRWWPSKEELIVDAVGHMRGELPPPPCSDDPRADLIATVRDGIRRFHASEDRGRLFPRLLDASVDNPAVAEAWRRRLIMPRRQAIADILERGIQRGELPAGLDMELAVDLLVAPIIYRLHVTGAATPEAVAERLVAVVWAGIVASGETAARPGARRS